MTLQAILDAIPHRPPFLWIDEVTERSDDAVAARKRVDPAEPCFRGHYPDFPITPGVLVLESMFQAGAVLLAAKAADEVAAGKVPVLTRIRDARFKAMVRPGDVLDVSVTLEDALPPAYHLEGTARVGDQTAATVKFSVAIARKGSA